MLELKQLATWHQNHRLLASRAWNFAFPSSLDEIFIFTHETCLAAAFGCQPCQPPSKLHFRSRELRHVRGTKKRDWRPNISIWTSEGYRHEVAPKAQERLKHAQWTLHFFLGGGLLFQLQFLVTKSFTKSRSGWCLGGSWWLCTRFE